MKKLLVINHFFGMRFSLISLFIFCSHLGFSQYTPAFFAKESKNLHSKSVLPNYSMGIAGLKHTPSFESHIMKPSKNAGKKSDTLAKKFYNVTDLSIKIDWLDEFGIGLNSVFAYRLHPKYSLGIGTGVLYDINEARKSDVIVPLFLSFRADLFKRPITPFFNVDAGFEKLIRNKYSTIQPPFWRTGLGMKFKMKSSKSLLVSLNLHQNKIRMPYSYFRNGIEYREYTDWQRYYYLLLRVGMQF